MSFTQSLALPDLGMCDPLCENPAKVFFFCDLLFSYGKEHSVKNVPLYL